MEVAEKTKEKGNIIEGLHFYTVRAQLKEFSKKADKFNKVLGILVPVLFLIWYIIPIARVQEIDYDFIKNCVLLVLVAIELLFNINYAVSDNRRKEKRAKKSFAKIIGYIRTILFALTCCVAIFDVITYDNSMWNTIIAAAMVVALAAKLVAIAASLIIKKVAGPILIAAAMDIEKIRESKLLNPDYILDEIDGFIKEIGGIEDDAAKDTEEVDFIDFVCEWAGDSKEKRNEFRELAEKLKEEEEAKKDKKFKAARKKLVKHAVETAGKVTVGAVKSKIGGFLGGKE